MVVLFLILASLCGLVFARVVWLKTSQRKAYLAQWEKTSETFEPIPAHDGRILTTDGQVLAFDERTFDVAMHYRWLQQPPDPGWLKQQAHRKLNATERRDTAKVEQAKNKVLNQRRQMLADLAVVTGTDPHTLAQHCQEVQSRVEGIRASVNARRDQRDVLRQDTTTPPLDATSQTTPAAEWNGLWDRVVHELTTPPVRDVREPIVVAEELDYHIIVRGISLDAVGLMESYPSRFSGVDVQVNSRRLYPGGALAAHTIGIRTPLRSDEERVRNESTGEELVHGYNAGDRVGRTGIERAYDELLHGQCGERRIVRNRQGEILSSEVVRQPMDGRDVVLSIDSRLQHHAELLLERALAGFGPPEISTGSRFDNDTNEPIDGNSTETPRPSGGCIVAIDIRSGELLAAAAGPTFDVSLLQNPSQAEWDTLRDDPRRPLFPRVTQAMLPPGSVFKTLTAVAAIESGLIDPSEEFYCRGYLDKTDAHRCHIYRHYGVGHGSTDMQGALCESCNVYFFDTARKIGPGPIGDWARRFGFGAKTGSDLPGEQRGKLPSPESATREHPWYPGTTLQLAIGQGELTVTPLQVARMMAAIANGGQLVTPHFVRPAVPTVPGDESDAATSGVRLVGHTVSQVTEFVHEVTSFPVVPIEGLHAETLSTIREGLRQVVANDRGTGNLAALSKVAIAGKTGTAEVGNGRADHAWFAGYAPADKPRVAFVVVLEHGGSGGRAAAPLARELVRKMHDIGIVR